MNKKNIKIEIHHNSTSYNMFVSFGILYLIIILGLSVSLYSFIAFMLFVLFFIPFCVFVELYQSRPMVISSNGETLRWKHLFKMREINISDIKSLSCEPYEVRSRYSTFQRVKLKIKVTDDKTIEFNDSVEAAALLKEKLNGTKSDIPLIKLYNFLKEKV